MSPEREITEPGELIHAPRPSWAPAFFALGAALAVCGVFAGTFMLPGWVYSIIGLIFLLAAFRQMVRGAREEFYRLPRHQRVRGAVLPVETITAPKN
jgi:uncharacterized membrane protein